MKTLAQLLRDKKTLSRTLGIYSERAKKFAVTLPDDNLDFDTNECIKKFRESQSELRKAKTEASLKSISTMVFIPDEIECSESGTDVPLFRAVLIRDDLKSLKSLLDQINNISTTPDRWSYLGDENTKPMTKKRNFNFEETLLLSDKLQEQIDEIDALIQYTDHVG